MAAQQDPKIQVVRHPTTGGSQLELQMQGIPFRMRMKSVSAVQIQSCLGCITKHTELTGVPVRRTLQISGVTISVAASVARVDSELNGSRSDGTSADE